MANDRNYFISKITGERISPAVLVEKMIEHLQELVDSGESQITDVNVGSEVRNILESMAMSMYTYDYDLMRYGEMTLVRYAEGGWLDDIGWQYNLTRKGASRSYGYVTFSIKTPLNVDYTIPEGTRLLNRRTGYSYVTTDDATIMVGETTVTAYAVAVIPGESSNCATGTITAFDVDQRLRNDLSVVNHTPFIGGAEEENDESYRARILEFLRGGKFGSLQYYRSICKEVTGVHDVVFIDPRKLNAIEPLRHTHKINNVEEECNSCTAVCVVNTETRTNQGEIEKVTNILTDQDNILLGHEFHVELCKGEKYYFSIRYYSEEGYGDVNEDVIDTVITSLLCGGTVTTDICNIEKTYFGYNIGQTVDKVEIIDAIENIKSIHHVESLKLLGWHNNFSSIKYLTKYIKEHDNSDFVYTSILDYPDEDEVLAGTGVFKDYSTSYPYWKPLEPQSTRGASGTITYQLEIEGYYFYKTRDNLNQDDNNAGEYPVSGKTDSGGWRWFEWGEKQFDTITVPIDAIPLVGSCTEHYDPDYPITTKFKLKNVNS